MVTGNQNRGREEKNLDRLLQSTSDNPQVYTPKKTPTGPGSATHLPDERTLENNNYQVHPFFQDIGWGTDFYSNLNNAGGYGGGMQDVSAQRGAGGTGGGSEDTEGNMDANQLLTLNPYLSKNVTSFNDGGMFGEFAKYNHGGTVGSVGPDGTNYSVGPHKSNKHFSAGYDGGAAENRINKIRKKEFMEQNNLNPYHVQFTSDSRADSPYMQSFNAELEKRQNNDYIQSIKDGSFGQQRDQVNLKNPWEEGYDNWYGQAKNGMRMPKYGNGGMMPEQQMPQQTESYAKQANDMIALAQLEAFGKKFASQMPQAKHGMKMKQYTQGGRF